MTHLTPTSAKILTDLLFELSTEIDLVYEDADFGGIRTTLNVMDTAADLLAEEGYDPPEAFLHVRERARRK